MNYSEAKANVLERWHLDQKFRNVDIDDFESLVTDFNRLSDTISLVAKENNLDANLLSKMVHDRV